jgi:methionine aminotransferase
MSKLPDVGTTIFTVMSKLANECQAINLSQGFPNFDVDSKLIETLKRTADNSSLHQYMPMGGFPKLTAGISETIQKTYGRQVDPERELLITAGATQGIFTTITALIKNGDEVIILDPSYDCYDPAVVLAGGRAVHVSLDNSFNVDWDKVEGAMNDRTRMIITNNPHNPSGRVWTENDFIQLESLLNKYPNVILLSDEVYEYITFENKHISINERSVLRDRSIIISSFGKTFHITGWKIGYLVAGKKHMHEIKKVHQFNVFSVNSISQATLAEYLTQVDLDSLGTFYQKKRDLFQSLLVESKFDLLPCEGTYFQTARYDRISDLDDVNFCKQLTTEHGVAAIPISVFNKSELDNKVIRFCFAKTDETLIEASKKLCKI